MISVRVRYQTIEFGNTDIHIRTLRDRQEFHDPIDTALELGIYSSSWSLFGVVWASGELLAHIMNEYDISGLRILEVGCGIGLASLVLNNRAADITATDYHPEAGIFLEENVKLNKGKCIPFIRTDWSEEYDELGKFDLIIGSDLLYEMGHVKVLSDFINRHAKPNCNVILVDPGRGYHSKFSKKMVNLGYSFNKTIHKSVKHLTQPMRNAVNFHILRYSLSS
ncbi:MAG: methyltransferase domain-containing protein [Magnetococcales bacterium]|nr:methyltransferase domain-containing protein [Magnetococcales bacterium]